MTFALIRSSGFTDGTRFFDHELNEIQEDIALSLDTRGGTYGMTDPIVFSGSAWTLPATTFTGDVSMSANTAIGNASSDTLSVAATATFTPRATFSNGIDVTVSAAVTGDVSVSGALTCTGSTVLGNSAGDTLDVYAGTTTFHETVLFSATVVLSGNLGVNGNTQLGNATSDTVLIAGSATAGAGCSIPERGLYLSTDADATLEWATVNYLHVPDGVLGADRTVTLSTAGVPEGAVFRACSLDTEYAVNIGGLYLRSASWTHYYLEFVFISGAWRMRRGDLGAMA